MNTTPHGSNDMVTHRHSIFCKSQQMSFYTYISTFDLTTHILRSHTLFPARCQPENCQHDYFVRFDSSYVKLFRLHARYICLFCHEFSKFAWMCDFYHISLKIFSCGAVIYSTNIFVIFIYLQFSTPAWLQMHIYYMKQIKKVRVEESWTLYTSLLFPKVILETVKCQ